MRVTPTAMTAAAALFMSVAYVSGASAVSPTTCTVAVGGTSPSMTIANAKGVVVWDNCYSNDLPGMCAQYLALRTLNPGARYSTARTWKQHIAGKVASRGTYKFEVSYAGLAIKKSFKFALIK